MKKNVYQININCDLPKSPTNFQTIMMPPNKVPTEDPFSLVCMGSLDCLREASVVELIKYS